MRKFLGTNTGPPSVTRNVVPPSMARTDDDNIPGQGSFIFSGFSGPGSIKTLPDIKCKDEFPSLLDDKRGGAKVWILRSNAEIHFEKFFLL